MYSDRLMQLFHSRAHAGALDGATHAGSAGVPGQGPYITLQLRVESERVAVARYKTFGCPASIGCAEAVCAWSEGQEVARLRSVTAEDVAQWVGGVPPGKEHCPDLAAAAMRGVRPHSGELGVGR